MCFINNENNIDLGEDSALSPAINKRERETERRSKTSIYTFLRSD